MLGDKRLAPSNSERAAYSGAWKLRAAAEWFSRQLEEKYIDCEIRVIKNSTNKHTIILAMASFIRNHFIFRSDWEEIPEYRKFMLSVNMKMKVQEGAGKSKHDDAPYSLGEFAKYFLANFGHIF